MALSDQLKYKIVSRLLNDDKPAAVAVDLDVPYSTVIRLNREVKEAKVRGDVASIMDLDKAILAELADEIAADTPLALKGDVKESLKVVADTRDQLEQLQLDLQLSAKVLVDRARSMAMSVESVGEVDTLADALCKLQNAFFNKNLTQVNVQNNYGTDGKYRSLLSDAPQPPIDH